MHVTKDNKIYLLIVWDNENFFSCCYYGCIHWSFCQYCCIHWNTICSEMNYFVDVTISLRKNWKEASTKLRLVLALTCHQDWKKWDPQKECYTWDGSNNNCLNTAGNVSVYIQLEPSSELGHQHTVWLRYLTRTRNITIIIHAFFPL